jgi:hypothetical protein
MSLRMAISLRLGHVLGRGKSHVHQFVQAARLGREINAPLAHARPLQQVFQEFEGVLGVFMHFCREEREILFRKNSGSLASISLKPQGRTWAT